MKLKEKIMAKFKAISAAKAALENFASATTEAGVEIYWEGDLAEGVAITIAGEGEEMIPAPEGDHAVIVDGVAKIVTLDAEGVVVEVKDADGTEDLSEEIVDEIVDEMAAIKAENEALKAQISEFEKTVNQVKADFAEFKKQFPKETKKETKFSANKNNPFVDRFVK